MELKDFIVERIADTDAYGKETEKYLMHAPPVRDISGVKFGYSCYISKEFYQQIQKAKRDAYEPKEPIDTGKPISALQARRLTK